MTVEVIIHDGMLDLRPNGAGDRHLRRDLWARFRKICRQGSINEPDLGRTVEFKFKKCYKLQGAAHETTLGHSQIERLSRALFVLCQALIEPLSSRVIYFWTDTMAEAEEVMEITELTIEEAAQALTVGDAPEGVGIVAEIPKSPRMPRPKKDKQVMVPVRVSPWNPLCTKLSVEDKGKVVIIETDEDKANLEDLIIEEEEDEGMEEETEPAHPPTKLPAYVPPRKAKAKVPKDLDKTKSSL